MNKDLKGLYAALLVPFDENGQVNNKDLNKLLKMPLKLKN